MLRITRKDRYVNSRMTVCAPTDLRPAANDIRERVRGGPCLGVVDKAVNLFVCGVVDTEAVFEEVGADVSSEV